jgi:hypothetical protein
MDIPHSLAFSAAVGGTLEIALRHGGVLGRDQIGSFFWMPASIMNWPSGRVAIYPHIRDRPKPGLIAVNRAGKRFVNEGNSYHDFVQAMLSAPETNNPAYLICDRDFIRDFGIGIVHPVWQWLPSYEKAGYLFSGGTLADLARKIGIDGQAFSRSVAIHNKGASIGVDLEFGKGSSALNRQNGDPDTEPNPCLRPIETPPFYAVRVHPAPIGSSIGLETNANAQVLDGTGRPIEGLYAVGNDMNSIMRGMYPGPGITLGPALVFGYRAAMHASSSNSNAGAPM